MGRRSRRGSRARGEWRVRRERPGGSGPSEEPRAHGGRDRLRGWLAGAAVALLVARPLYPSESAAAAGDGLVTVMLWALVAAGWLAAASRRPRFSVRFGWVDLALVLLVLWHGAAALGALRDGSPRPAVNMLWEWVGYGLAFLLLRQLVVSDSEARGAMAAMVAVAVALSGYGLYQVAVELPAARAHFARDPEQALRQAGLWYEPGSPERILFQKRLESTEPVATFALTNSLAGYLVPWLVVAVGIGVGGGGGRESRRALRSPGWAGGLCAVAIASCLVLTKSRSGLLAATAGIAAAVVFCRSGRRTVGWKVPAAMAGLAAILVAAALAAGGLDIQVLTEAGKSLGYRLQYWRATGRMIADRPVLGCGPGNFQFAYTGYMAPEASEEIAEPHNFLLEVAATAGLPAGLMLLTALGCWYARAFRRGDSRAEPAETGSTATPWYVLGGGVLGFLLAVPLGAMSAAPPSRAAVALGLPASILVLALLGPWVRSGGLPPKLPAVALGALLLNLLAAGGIGFPGVAGSLWLLMALGLRAPGTRELPRGVGLAALAGVVALAGALYASAYRPVLAATAAVRQAQRDPGLREIYLKQAAEADPLWAEPWKQLTDLALQRWKASREPAPRAAFEQYARQALRRMPNAASASFQVANWYYEAFEASGSGSALRQALALYRQAVRLYPVRSLYRGRWALALAASGDAAAARREAMRALTLDQINPHPDKDLPEELQRQLQRITSDGSDLWHKENL